MKNRLSLVTAAERDEQSERACASFIKSAYYYWTDVLLSYMSMEGEFDPGIITRQAIAESKEVAVPRCVPHSNEMNFYCLDRTVSLESQLVAGLWGIREPVALQERYFYIPADCTKNIVVIVPGVAFTRDGRRMGHGRGYYDTYLSVLLKQQQRAKNNVLLVGACLLQQLVEDIPIERTDVRMDYLLTADGLSTTK